VDLSVGEGLEREKDELEWRPWSSQHDGD
jgi:hypothetical protein